MKRQTTLLTLALVLLAAGSAQAGEIFSVSGPGNCNHTSNGTNGVQRTLAAGTHYLTLSGAVSYWSSNGHNGGNTWITALWAHDLTNGESFAFSGGQGWQPTPTAASDPVAGQVFEFELQTTATVSFVINDGGGCHDNRGAITVSLDDPAVPTESSSWSALKATYR